MSGGLEREGRLMFAVYNLLLLLASSALVEQLGGLASGGVLSRDAAMALGRSSASITSYSWPSAHFICKRMTSSSSTMSKLGFIVLRYPCPGGTLDNSPTFQRWEPHQREQ